MSRRLPPMPREAGYAAPARKIRYPRPRGQALPPLPGASTHRRSYALSPLLAALGIDCTLEDVVELAKTDPDEAERKLAAYRKALVPITGQLRGAEADSDAMLRLAHRAKAEGKPAIELVPEVAAAEGWKVRGNPRRRLTITTANGRTMTLAPPVNPAPRPRNRAPRARSPRRRTIRSSSAASRDGPESDSDPLAPRPAHAGLEAVLSPDASRARQPRFTWRSAALEPDSGPSRRARLAAAVYCEFANGAGVLDPAPSMPTVASRLAVALATAHEGRQELEQAGTRQLARALARPGDRICDPFLSSGATAVASLAEGCDVDAEAIATRRRRLAV